MKLKLFYRFVIDLKGTWYYLWSLLVLEPLCDECLNLTTFVCIHETVNVTIATKANEPVFCQLKCLSH